MQEAEADFAKVLCRFMGSAEASAKARATVKLLWPDPNNPYRRGWNDALENAAILAEKGDDADAIRHLRMI